MTISFKLVLQILLVVFLVFGVYRLFVGPYSTQSIVVDFAPVLILLCSLGIIEAIERKP